MRVLCRSDGFGGIGVRIRLIEEGVLVLSVMEGTPAETAGLRQDDVIVGIDGSTIEGLSQEDVVSQLRGRPGSEVRLSIDREEAAAPLVLTVERSRSEENTSELQSLMRISYAVFCMK